jgi:hypothetical protein
MGSLHFLDTHWDHEPRESPSTALRAPSPPLGEKDGMRGFGSWGGKTSKDWTRIGAMNLHGVGARHFRAFGLVEPASFAYV